MSAFFAPEPEPEPTPARPVYREDGPSRPPNGVVAGVLAVESVVARSKTVVIALESLLAYPTGIGFDVHILGSQELDHDVFGLRGGGEGGGVLIGVGFADGRRATSRQPGDGGLAVTFGGGGGGGGRMAIRGYVHSLPPLGPLTFAAAWPAAEVPEGTLELDAAPLLEAAARAQVVFDLPERPPDDPDASGWERYR